VVSKRKPPVNLVPHDVLFFQHELEKIIPDHHLVHYTNALVTPDGVVLANGQIVEESLFAANHKDYFDGLYKRFYLLSGWFADRRKNQCLLAFDAWAMGYFHWMTEFIPRLFKARHLIDGSIVILPAIDNGIWNHESAIRSLFKASRKISPGGYYKDSLEAFGIQATYQHKTRKPLKVDDLYLSGRLAMSGNYDDDVMKNLREFYFKHYGINSDMAGRLVYATRRLASRRHIKNEKEVVDYLRSMGFEIVTFETLSFREQIQLLSETKFLIAQHGAALTNLLFMRDHSYALELKAEGDSQNLCYFSLANAMNVNYLYQFCTSDRRTVQNADIEVDLVALNENVKQVLNS
jgi:hypothetical protein